jgi:hypothetical protein
MSQALILAAAPLRTWTKGRMARARRSPCFPLTMPLRQFRQVVPVKWRCASIPKDLAVQAGLSADVTVFTR